MKNDHRSKFSNLSNWKEEAWEKSGLQRDSNPIIIGEKNWTLLATLFCLLSLYTIVDETKSITIIFDARRLSRHDVTFPAIARHTQNLAKVTIQGTREKNKTLKDIYFKISTGFYKTANTSTTEDGNNILINHFLNHVSTRQRVIADYHVKRNLQACEINLLALFVGGHVLGTKLKSPTGVLDRKLLFLAYKNVDSRKSQNLPFCRKGLVHDFGKMVTCANWLLCSLERFVFVLDHH